MLDPTAILYQAMLCWTIGNGRIPPELQHHYRLHHRCPWRHPLALLHASAGNLMMLVTEGFHYIIR